MADMSGVAAQSPAMPNSLSRATVSSASADERSVFVGMQPVCRHVPPSFARSTSVTSTPAFAAANAAE